MLSNSSSDALQPSLSGDTEVSLLNPQDPIEVMPVGNGTVNDPAASDTKPPYAPGDLDGFLG
jgi:hypothetical protein